MNSTSKPDILLVIVDSLRADHVGCYGYARDTTPTIDRLASEGCRFETCITAAPFSPASYASLISNLYPHQHGVNGDTIRVWPDHWPRLPERMKEHGYYTFCLSNNSFVTAETNSARGFDTFRYMRNESLPLRQYFRVLRRVRKHFGERAARLITPNALHCQPKGDSRRTVQTAADIIQQTRQPCFGLLILMDPHTPYNRQRLRYAGKTPAVRQFFREYNQRAMWAEIMAQNGALPEHLRSVALDLYDADTRHADDCIGLLIDRLATAGRLDNTIIAVSADHGEAFGERGVWGHGFCLNDCLTRVPLILRHPGYWPGGSRSQALVQFHDLHELCLSVADTGEPNTDRHPHSLTQAANSGWTGREAVFSEFPRQSMTLDYMKKHSPAFNPGVWDLDMWAVRDRRWRYLEYSNGECELYDLENDPAETTSVRGQKPETCANLHGRLAAHRQTAPSKSAIDTEQPELDEAVLDRLRALGYIA